jgi:hypothetical protein
MQYDPLLGAWTVSPPCRQPAQPTPLVLAAFRHVQRMPGARAPACYQISYECEQCDDLHLALATQTILDWDPLMGLWPVYFDLMTGKDAWGSNHQSWLDNMLRGQWPLQGWCSTHRKATGLHPTLLRAISPGEGDSYTVCFSCPACQDLEIESMRADRLAYGAI